MGRAAIQIDAFGNDGIHFYTATASTVAKNSSITVNERVQISAGGITRFKINKNATAVEITTHDYGGTHAFNDEARLDFLMRNEVTGGGQATGNPAARIASYLERGNNGFGLKFFARTNASTLFPACQVTPDYEFEPCLDNGMNLGSDDRTWNKAYYRNGFPDHGSEQVISGSSFSNGQWYDTGFQRNSVGGLDTNGTYIVTALADLYQAMGGNYSVTYTWIVGLRDQYTNQTLVNSCQLLSVCGHSTNNFGASGATVGDGIRLGTSRQPSSQGGMEKIVWKPAVSTGEINNTDGGRILRFRIQRIGRSSTG